MKRILVTGGSGAIGSAIVHKFSNVGHIVYAPTREELDLTSTPKLTDTKFDVVINNAGINPLNDMLNADDMVMQVNYLSPLRIVQQCLPHMIENGYGRILNIGSIWVEQTKKNRSAYSASKAALDAMSRSITAEYAQHNILANTLSPGFVDTPLTHKNNSESEIETLRSQIPVRRLASPNEIADYVYMLTIKNTYISGQNIVIDGGFSCVR